MLTLEGYDRADLQPHADALHTELLRFKAGSAFVPKAGEKLSRKTIEARIRVFQKSIDAIIGSQRHALQTRLFSPALKVGKDAALHSLKRRQCCDAHDIFKTLCITMHCLHHQE